MELWIRSLNKYILIKADFIYIEPVSIKEKDGYYIKAKHGINNMYSDYTLGHYKTERRALEVLDEIQKLLMPISECKQESDSLIINYKNIDTVLKIDTVLYEMPQD